MAELVTAFGLGTIAISNNVCLLPLYPGLMAFIAGNSNNERTMRATAWLGVLVLAGVLSMMLLIGLVLFVLRQSFGTILPVLLPLIYGVVIALGVLMMLNRNPFARLSMAQTPILSNPYITAYLYGMLLGPMTLPCTGPIVLSGVFVSAGSGGDLVSGLLYFLAFGLGFGWPLVLLPLVASSAQRRFIDWLTHRHVFLTRASGVILIGIGLLGIVTELIPNI